MHACDLDGHTSALLGIAMTLSKFRGSIKGTIIFIFQHAKEKPLVVQNL
jgi:metal-dependent amidase/aminoacylase/carboxypeptidase family protein